LKRVLLDENMPRQIRRDLPEFVVRTVQEEGWDGLTNGQLLRRASDSFDVLFTADQRLRHQQNIATFAIGVVVIEPTTPDSVTFAGFCSKSEAPLKLPQSVRSQ